MSRDIKPTTVRFDDDDKRMIEIVKKKYGQSSLIGALRSALRVAAGESNAEIANTLANKPQTDNEKGKGI
jgi:hypothetical protein